MESQDQATSLPDANPSKVQYTKSGVVPGHEPTCLPNSVCMESTTKEGAPVAEGPVEETNGIGDSRQNDRDRNTFLPGNSLRVQNSGWSIPGKIWIQTNQIRVASGRAHVPRELRARAPQASRGI